MRRSLNRDTIVAVFLLLFCGLFLGASFEIEETNYGTMQASVWPRIVLAALAICSLLLLTQALRHPPAPGEGGGMSGWLRRYRSPLICYLLFLLFLLTLPWLGMLAGGILFVFLMLSVLGGPGLANAPIHGAIAVISVGAMWAIFTFALGVFLPSGEIPFMQ